MNFFILYVALPALFYRILAKTPFEQLNNVPFIVTATLSTFLVLALSFGVGVGDPARSRAIDHRGAGRRLRQYRLYGAGAGAGDARRAGGGAGRADLLLRDAAVLLAGAVPDGARRPRSDGFGARGARGGAQDRTASADDRDRARRAVGGGPISSRRSRSTGCCSSCRTRRRPARCSRSASRWRCGRSSGCRGRCRCWC